MGRTLLPLALLVGLLSAAPVAAEEPPSGLAATDRGKIVEFWKSGGPAVQAAAEAVLTGSDEQAVQGFLNTGRSLAEHQDDQETAQQIVTQGGPALRDAALRAMAGTPQDLDAFIRDGWQKPLEEDQTVEATRIADNGGPGVKQAGGAALNGSTAQVQKFLNHDQYEQRDADDLVQATQVESAGGPNAKRAAALAMDGSIEDVREFLATGQYVARAHDQEFATVTQLAEQAKAAGERAEKEKDAAKNALDRALVAARLAKAAAATAAAETKAALGDATRASEAARRAVEATSRAADAAQASIAAARAATAAAHLASSAASNAAYAAAGASQAASRTLSAAAAGVVDENTIHGALLAAQQAGKAADWAGRASVAAAAVTQMATAVNEVSDNLDAALASADEAANYMAQAGTSSAVSTAAAAKARRYAKESTRAARAAAALAAEAAADAGVARDAARSAATHAQAAADAAAKATSHAGDAAAATEQARIHSVAAQAAADAATAAVAKATTVEQGARDADAEEVTARTTDARNRAADLTAAYDVAQAATTRAQGDAKKLDEDFVRLAAQAAQPGADVEQVIADGRRMAVAAMKIRGPWSSAAAEFALAGSDAAVVDYARTGWQTAQKQDDFDQTQQIAQDSPYDAVRTAANEALTGDAAHLRTFVESGQHEAAALDYRVEVTRISQSGGPGLKQAGDTAFNAGTTKALVDFLTVTQYQARDGDDRVLAARLAQNGGAEMKVATESAVNSPPSILRTFIETGQYHAQQQDQLTAAHLAQVQQVIAEAADVAAKARQSAADAAKTYALARKATAEANGYAQQAQKEADAAAQAAQQAQNSARQAEQSATQAAESARTARTAQQQAVSSADEADQSATWARASFGAAQESAGLAYAAAIAARTSAEQSGKDAKTVAAIFNEALTQAEEQERIRQNTDRIVAAWEAQFYQNLPTYLKGVVYFNSLPLETKFKVAMEAAHVALDLYGALPVVGEPAAIANCVAYGMEGRIFGDSGKYVDAALACGSVVPIGGLGALSIKLEKWGVKTEKFRQALEKFWKVADDLPSCLTEKNSFPAGTRVLMGDGTARPIEQIRVGDAVRATDPETGEAGPRSVEATIYTPNDQDFTDIAVKSPDSGAASLTATDHHPFWSESRHEWTDASLLTTGDTLRAPSGEAVWITEVRHRQILQPAFNLTVQGLHTYYVLAGATPVLVHNCSNLTLAQRFRPGLAHTLSKHFVSPDRARGFATATVPNSVWNSAELAQEVANYAATKHSAEIANWLRSSSQSTKTFLGTYGNTSLGTVYYADRATAPTATGSKYVMQICRDKAFKGGYYIRTIYPK
ncbi:polymorphic toxin-type HINT domain-containing protein [Streptomyces sp. SPB162]|uniref:polymorphic toxin-type HINT domain-containing protein n=1 Tax=Streptomyces sp. SPB162 TaxID=2940560 RepID=UPI002404E112|nr:polymorphic toxin-type HINT domain-containing protein [Streptomyces sp. SPB162]MDF9816425.1 hypothetical protein [Streptomyces sp. SPB162]